MKDGGRRWPDGKPDRFLNVARCEDPNSEQSITLAVLADLFGGAPLSIGRRSSAPPAVIGCQRAG